MDAQRGAFNGTGVCVHGVRVALTHAANLKHGAYHVLTATQEAMSAQVVMYRTGVTRLDMLA